MAKIAQATFPPPTSSRIAQHTIAAAEPHVPEAGRNLPMLAQVAMNDEQMGYAPSGLASEFVLATITCIYPTLPSSEMPTSFCASTANSMGRVCMTSLQKPLTIIDVALSGSSPRWRQ